MKKNILTSLCFIITFNIFPAPYNGETMKFKQPDGTWVEVVLFGDEYYMRAESPDGYTLIRDKKTGWICYAQLSTDGKSLESSGIKFNPVRNTLLKSSLTLNKHIDIPFKNRNEIINQNKLKLGVESELQLKSANVNSPAPNTVSGNYKGLCIVVDFSDEPSEIGIEEFEELCNGDNYTNYDNNGSLKQFYKDISGGLVEYENYVFGWYRAPKTFAEYNDMGYGAGAQQILDLALNWIDSKGFDFSSLTTNENNKILAINLMYTGYPPTWAEGMWYHAGYYSGFSADGVSTRRYNTSPANSPLTIGTICHENGHMLCGWPDTYKYDGSSDGIGSFDLMCSTGNRRDPSPPNPHFRNEAGWGTIIDITDFTQTYTSIANDLISYKYMNPSDSAEYFLIENRRRTGRSKSIPDEGLTIWHINENGNNQSNNHEVFLEHAGGDMNKHSVACYHKGYVDEFSGKTYFNSDWNFDGPSSLVVYNIGEIGDTLAFNAGQGTSDMLDKAFWKSIYTDSYQDEDKPEFAFDKIPTTLWHTEWSPNNPGHPHEIQIDLGAEYVLNNFRYLPRHDGLNGTISQYEIFLSNDTSNWGNAKDTGTWESNDLVKHIKLQDTARFVKLIALAEVQGNPWTSVSELFLYGTISPYSSPARAIDPYPHDNKMGVNTLTELSWSSGEGATTHNIYIGTVPELDSSNFKGNQAENTFMPNEIVEKTTYYWRIDEVNSNGVTKGDVWNFSTLDRGIFTHNQDIGNVRIEGTAGYSEGIYTLEGSGGDIWDRFDEFHYLYKNFVDTGEIVTKVISIENTNDWAKGGVMLRESTYSSSKFAMVVKRPDNAISFQWRTNSGTEAEASVLKTGLGLNTYIKIARTGDIFSAYYSTKDTLGPWTQLGDDITIQMDSAYAGLCLTSHNDGVICTAQFSNVNINSSIISIPFAATRPSPSNRAKYENEFTELSWTSGKYAKSHDVYFSTDSEIDSGDFKGNQIETTYNPGSLTLGNTYYWRVDEVNNYGITKGSIWQFTVNTQTNISLYENASIKIYPNPFNGKRLTVFLSGNYMNKSDIYIYDILGKMIVSESIRNTQKLTLTFNEILEPGIYFISIKNDLNTLNKKIVVK